MADGIEQRLTAAAEARPDYEVTLLELAEERGRLTGETRETTEALEAAEAARRALSAVDSKLGSTSSWSTYDTFFGGGAMSSAVKHSWLDEAARAAFAADRCIAVLRRELDDVPGNVPGAPALAMDGLTRFVDIWFDNVFTDFAVAGRIRQAQQNVARSGRMVSEVQTSLRERAERTRARLETIEADRRGLLSQP